MKANSYVSGIGGWLAFLIASLMVISPLLGFGNLYGTFSDVKTMQPILAASPEWLRYKAGTWFIFALFAAISYAAGYRLWKIRTPESVRFAVAAIWLVGPVAQICHAGWSAVALGQGIAANGLASTVGEVAGSCIIATFWTLYLLRSTRVHNTYAMGLIAQQARTT